MTTTDSPLQHQAQDAEGLRAGIYMASKTTHAPRWREFRDGGLPIISTWIDEAGKGETACFKDLWRRCVSEACAAQAVIVYREPGEVLKGAFVEAGAALATGVPVFTVGCEEFSFVNHAGVKQCYTIEHALNCALSASPPQAETPGLDREAAARIATFVRGAMFSEMAIQALPFLEQEEPRAKAVEVYTNCITETIADAILAATAVSQPQTGHQGAGEVKALGSGRDERLWWFLKIIQGMSGSSDASESKWSWTNSFCDDRGDATDTFNIAADRKLTCVTHDSDTDHSVVYITQAGRDYVRTHVLPAQPGPAPVGDGGAIEAVKQMVALHPHKDDNEILISHWEDRGRWTHLTFGQLRRACAALDSIPAVGGTKIPEGWRIVPVEPTETMTDAWWDHTPPDLADMGGGDIAACYRAMLAAAPLPAAPTQTARDGGE